MSNPADKDDEATRTGVRHVDPKASTEVGRPESQEAELAAGQVLAGRYEVRGAVGAGGMGSVWRVYDRELREEVALKLLPRQLGARADMLERFRREVKTARRISHPNVCRTHDLGEHKGQRFLTMELVEGRSLRALMRDGVVPLGRARELLQGILAGVAAAHAQGVIHRDIKPENVIVRDDGRPVVVDFGLAFDPGQDGSNTQVAGTTRYMSPEQLRGERLDVRSDVFSCGIVVFELLSGRSPFGEGAPSLVASAILRDTPAPLSTDALPAHVRPAVQSVLERALAKLPEERYANAGDLAAALDGALGSGIVERAVPRSATGETTPGKAGGPVRSRAPWIVGAGVLLVALAAGAVALSRRDDPPRPAPPAAAAAIRGAAADERPSVAVSAFVDQRGAGGGTLAATATDTIRTSLRSVGEVRLVTNDAAADWVVAGSIQEVGRQLRVSFQVNRPDGSAISVPLDVDGDPADVSALLDRLRRRAADELQLLGREHAKQVRAERGTSSETARRALQRYLALVGPGPQEEHVEVGRRLLDEAIAADPRYVPALVDRAFLYVMRAFYEREAAHIGAALADLEAALAVDPESVEAKVMMCTARQIALVYEETPVDATFDAALAACGAALEAAPASGQVRLIIARLEETRCRYPNAIEAAERAWEMDRSLGGALLVQLVYLTLATGQVAAADRYSRALLDLQEEEERLQDRALHRRAGTSGPQNAHLMRAAVLLARGELDEASVFLQRELELARGVGATDMEAAAIRGLARIARGGGAKVPAALQRRLVRIESDAARDTTGLQQEYLASSYLLTDPEAALVWLEKGVPTGCGQVELAAMAYEAIGRKGDRRWLSRCQPRVEWERQCFAYWSARLAE